MKNNKLKTLLVTILTLAGLAFHSEEDFTKLITGKLERYHNTYPVEKAFLHTDKPYYVVGDTLWFKAYLVEGTSHQADSVSRLLYVDLVENRSGKNYALNRTLLEGGLGNGELVLHDSIPAGAYTLRAYTSWMRNASADFFFQKDIYIFDQTGAVPQPAGGKVDLQFFPEGGRLLEGVGSRVAFKAIGENGKSAKISGFVLNQTNDTVASFKSEHLGMGRFPFEAKAGDTYRAFMRNAAGEVLPCNFPKIETAGYTMIVDNISSATKARVIAYAKLPGKADLPVHVVGHSRGVVSFVAKGKIATRGLMMSIPTTDLPDGITHITLFDEANRPVSERLIFIDHAKKLQVQVTPSKNTFKPKEKTEIEITLKDSAGKPVEAGLSVSVTDGSQILQQPFEDDIVSNLLLTSDLKGHIEQPAYYFDQNNSNRKVHLDYLMATQGWTRFDWNEVMQDSLPAPKYVVEQGVMLSGEVKRNRKTPTEIIPISVYLSNDSLNTFLSAETDATGRFAIYNLVFSDSLKVRMQGMGKKNNQNLVFSVDAFNPPRLSVVRVPFYPVTVDAQAFADFLKRTEQEQEITRRIRENRERLLKEVTIKAKKEVQRDSRKIYGNADATIKVTPQMAAGSMTVLDMLAGRVAGVQVNRSGMNASVFIRGNRQEPQFLLDGMPVDKDFVINMNVNDVESIDVLKGGSAAIVMNGANGVISILTKRGNSNYDYSQDVVPGVLTTKIAGFNVPKQFYTPAYTASALPDFRSTIFWAPMLRTDRNGKVKFEYYNTDANAKVNVQVQAMSPGGLPGYGTATYSVN